MDYSTKRENEQAQLGPDLDEIRRTLDVLFEPGDVVEIRAFKDRRCTISGYYDDFDKLAKDAVRVSQTVGTVYVTLSVHNAAKIWKLYGTMAGKGDSLPDRPHRRARFLHVPAHVDVVPVEKLRVLAETAPDQDKGDHHIARRSTCQRTGDITFDLDNWISHYRLAVTGPESWQGGRKWVFRTCPWNADHTNRSAFIVQRRDGSIGAGCHHNGCQGKGCHALRDVVEPGWRDKRRTSVSSSPGAVPESWREPQPLPDELPPVARFDVNLLPRLIGPWISDIARRVQCPSDFPAVAAMIGLAGVVDRKVGIRPKRKDDWLVVAGSVPRDGLQSRPMV
jgi:hypothetical protein